MHFCSCAVPGGRQTEPGHQGNMGMGDAWDVWAAWCSVQIPDTTAMEKPAATRVVLTVLACLCLHS